MKLWSVVKLAAVDFVLVAVAYLVLQDVSWRDSYAVANGNTASTTFSLLTRVFSMTMNGDVRTSPPTLDWVQVVVACLIIINVGFAFGAFRSREKLQATGV